MHREPKYRFWTGTEMVAPQAIYFDQINGEPEFSATILWDDVAWGSDDGGMLLQFTGLYDRDGKEIYEGDILEVTTPHTFGGLGVVQYLDGGFWIETPRGDRQMPSQDYRRVIGNIYENADRVSWHQGRIVVLAHV